MNSQRLTIFKNIEQLPKEMLDYLTNIMEYSTDIILTTDLQAKIQEFNKRAENILGYRRSEVVGQPLNNLWLDKVKAQSLVQDVLRGNVVCEDKTRLVKKTGEPIDISFTLSPMKNAKDRIGGAVLIARDITEEKRIDKEFNEMKSQTDGFMVHVSHGLKSPLVSLEGYIAKLEDRCKDRLDEKGYYYLAKLKKNIFEMRSLIQDLLDFYKTGMVAGYPEQVDIRQMVESSIDELKLEIEKREVHLIIQNELPVINCHRECAHQIFSNLISNAIKFSDDSRSLEITIGYHERPQFHEFFVRDNGIGIDPKYHDKIFEIFQRLEQKRNVEGSGIGLAIVKKAVEHHGGTVWVRSEQGKGATFYFTFPKASHI
jgi:PAS domain S-box-containing protein